MFLSCGQTESVPPFLPLPRFRSIVLSVLIFNLCLTASVSPSGQVPLTVPGEEGAQAPVVRAQARGQGAPPSRRRRRRVRRDAGSLQVQVRRHEPPDSSDGSRSVTLRPSLTGNRPSLPVSQPRFLSRRSPSEQQRSSLSSSGQIRAAASSLSPFSSPSRALSPSASPASSLIRSR